MTRTQTNFRMEIEPKYEVAMCDVCTEMVEAPHVKTYLGNSAQSDVCMNCAKEISTLIRRLQTEAARAAARGERDFPSDRADSNFPRASA